MSKTTIIFLALIFIGFLYLLFITKSKAPAYISNGNTPQKNTFRKVAPCDVCTYALKDNRPHPVEYCPMCDAWICERCAPNLPLRAIAMANRKFNLLTA